MSFSSRFKSMLCSGLVILIALSMSSGRVNAEEDYARTGGYVAVGVLGAAYTEIDGEFEDTVGAAVDLDETAGFQLLAGIRTDENVALEIEFEYLAPSDVEALDSKIAEIESLTTTLNMKIYPMRERFQPYLLFGTGIFWTEVSQKSGGSASDDDLGFVLRFGGGLDFHLTEQFFLNVGTDYVLPIFSSVDDFDYVSFGAGVGYRF